MPMTKPQQMVTRLHHRAGFALLEVLISFVVLAFGMLGIAGLLLTSHKANASSYIRQQAIQSMSNMADRIRANGAAAGGYAIDNTSSNIIPSVPNVICSGTTACSPSQLSAYDVWDWLDNDLAKRLPAGRGAINVQANGSNTNVTVTITVQWDDAPAQRVLGSSAASPASPPNLSRMSIQTLL